MHEDAEQRLQDFVKQLDRPGSIASRIEAMLPLIDEARERGATWAELVVVLGIQRSTLLGAYARAAKKAGRVPSRNKPKHGKQKGAADGQ